MSKLTWNAMDLEECRIARRAYQRMREEGYRCRQGGDLVTVFEPERGEASFERTPNRYERLLEDSDGDDCFDS